LAATTIEVRSRLGADDIADPNSAAPEDSRCHATMTAHRSVATGTDGFLHARTRLARADDLQQRITDLELGVPQRKQVDAGDHEVATQSDWIDMLYACQTCNDIQVLRLDERHLPRGQLRLTALTQPVISQSDPGESHGMGHSARVNTR
jgi:hypothetical protein